MAKNAMSPQLKNSDLKIFELLGEGTTAKVYRGMYKDQEVAVKQISIIPQLTEREETNLQREVSIISHINHPKLVKCFGLSFIPGTFQIVLEYCAGGTLFDLLHNHPDVEFSDSQRQVVIMGIAQAMEYLHNFTPQIIHRDLKSLNVLLAKLLTENVRPLVKVTDFGFARMREEGGIREKMTSHVGTSHWMAPEVTDEGGHYDEKVDVYSFAIVLYEILCRMIPFAELEGSVVLNNTRAGYRPNLDLVPDIPEFLRVAMIACWAQNPINRPSFAQIVATFHACGMEGDRPTADTQRMSL